MRYYSNIAAAATLANAGGISTGTTTLQLSTTTGLPTFFPFTLRLDPDTASEELVSVTSGAGTSGTPYVVTRGFDGTTAKTHNFGAPVVHSGSAIDFREPQEHMANVTPGAVHGLPASAWQETIIVFKNSDQAYNNDITYNDDLELTFALEANTNYRVELNGSASGDGGNIVVMWSVPSGTTGERMVLGPPLSSTNINDTNMRSAIYSYTTDIGYGLTSGSTYFQEKSIVYVGATAGNLTIRHHQYTSNATPTVMKKGSYLVITKLNS